MADIGSLLQQYSAAAVSSLLGIVIVWYTRGPAFVRDSHFIAMEIACHDLVQQRTALFWDSSGFPL